MEFLTTIWLASLQRILWAIWKHTQVHIWICMKGTPLAFITKINERETRNDRWSQVQLSWAFCGICSTPRRFFRFRWWLQTINSIQCFNLGSLEESEAVSQWRVISKVLEKAVTTQLHSHLTHNSLYEPFPSGFCPLHSTETALLKITSDILISADSGLLSTLILLDWKSEAFDTTSHTILLHWLSSISIAHTTLNLPQRLRSLHPAVVFFIQVSSSYFRCVPRLCPGALYFSLSTSSLFGIFVGKSSFIAWQMTLHSISPPSPPVYRKSTSGSWISSWSLTVTKQKFFWPVQKLCYPKLAVSPSVLTTPEFPLPLKSRVWVLS